MPHQRQGSVSQTARVCCGKSPQRQPEPIVGNACRAAEPGALARARMVVPACECSLIQIAAVGIVAPDEQQPGYPADRPVHCADDRAVRNDADRSARAGSVLRPGPRLAHRSPRARAEADLLPKPQGHLRGRRYSRGSQKRSSRFRKEIACRLHEPLVPFCRSRFNKGNRILRN